MLEALPINDSAPPQCQRGPPNPHQYITHLYTHTYTHSHRYIQAQIVKWYEVVSTIRIIFILNPYIHIKSIKELHSLWLSHHQFVCTKPVYVYGANVCRVERLYTDVEPVAAAQCELVGSSRSTYKLHMLFFIIGETGEGSRR